MTGMLQRCWEHDYRAPCFYLITVVTAPRRSCLSSLHTQPDGTAALTLSAMGEIVAAVWQRTSATYPGVEACEHVVMPDHFHGILWVKERLPRPMGHIVKAFKRVCVGECRSKGLLLPPNPRKGLPPNPAAAPAGSVPAAAPAGSVSAAAPAADLWQDGFQDTILLRRGQLRAMVRYIADNPRRLAAKRANPALFTVATHLPVAGGQAIPMLGNRFLLDYPLKCQVQISRRITPEALAHRQAELLAAAAHGAVLVSPCISPGEKAIARAALAAGHRLIVLLANGFPPLYKPPGHYFDACSAGRLLMIAPFPYQRRRTAITRDQCLDLNALAQRISETGDHTKEI